MPGVPQIFADQGDVRWPAPDRGGACGGGGGEEGRGRKEEEEGQEEEKEEEEARLDGWPLLLSVMFGVA